MEQNWTVRGQQGYGSARVRSAGRLLCRAGSQSTTRGLQTRVAREKARGDSRARRGGADVVGRVGGPSHLLGASEGRRRVRRRLQRARKSLQLRVRPLKQRLLLCEIGGGGRSK